MRKKIAFKSHETRGQDIIKILERMGGINKYNLDGSKGIIAIETNRGNYITNDWDYCGLLLNGWEIYNLEAYENLEKTAQDFAVDVLLGKRDCYFDDLDAEILAETYMAGYDKCNQNRRNDENTEYENELVNNAFLDKVEKYLRDNIILYVYATTADQQEEWFNNFRKAMEE